MSENLKKSKFPSKWIKLNVGGKLYVTTLSTLINKEPNSMLSRMFSQGGMNPSDLDEEGAYLIDRSPHYFEPIINYLRHGQLIYDSHLNTEGILEEAKFFGIESLIPQLEAQLAANNISSDNIPLTRREVIRALIQTSYISELRFQGINLAGADLRKLDFRNINFKYACLAKCNLSHANLTHCCLERTDLSYANMECAQLVSVRGLCANMEGANLQGCNFEDPTGFRTNLEGVNLKGACLEGSNMAGVNLRVANLKDANMKNCVLRAAVLAGADLERCNLSGSDLQEANLRGANLKDAELELMVTPLHMSQAIR
ncbi:BTB/POZ domain-containing protein KCTD9 [Condylostylus longicornis]|uniref:BTB/POZ domain-containing protein KCTD9 n=1 Tax=Condylostylus longicornis TaxID=2530218 RepID=UPI00244E21D3|nr:BTB/POZ domain-containing protein KCTD9 [Condylostylus longicornis]